MEGQGRLSRSLGAENLHHPSLWQPSHPQGKIEGEGPGGDDGDLSEHCVRAQLHDGALPVLPFDLGDG